MKLRLHEIELNSANPEKSKIFYQSVLGLENTVDQDQLKVFHAGLSGLDFNVSSHFSAERVVTSFVTDNLSEVIDRLKELGIPFADPKKSHLGMVAIEFRDPDGYLIKVNQTAKDAIR